MKIIYNDKEASVVCRVESVIDSSYCNLNCKGIDKIILTKVEAVKFSEELFEDRPSVLEYPFCFYNVTIEVEPEAGTTIDEVLKEVREINRKCNPVLCGTE